MKTIKKIITLLLTFIICACCILGITVPASAAAGSIPYGTPKIDGKADGIWESASMVKINLHNSGDESVNATGYARLMWDETYLYCLGVVNDSDVSNGTKDLTAAHASDSFELFLVENPEGKRGDTYICQFRVDAYNNLSGMLKHQTKTAEEMMSNYPTLKKAASIGNGGYTVEIAVPWKETKPKQGAVFTAEFQINDEQNNSGEQDGIINSACPEMWDCSNYRSFTLDKKAAVTAPATTSSSATTSDSESTATTSSNVSSSAVSDTGSSSEISSVASEQPESDISDTVSEPSSDVNNKTDEESKDKSNSGTLAIIIIAVLVILAGAGTALYFFVIKKKGKGDNNA